MKNNRTWKSVVASVLVTAALVTPSVVLSSTPVPYDAELIFQINEKNGLSVQSDGSIQLLVDVAVDRTINATGAAFHLRYNRDYLEPSYIVDQKDADNVDHKANESIHGAGRVKHDGFFRQDEDLFMQGDNFVDVIKDYKYVLIPGVWYDGYYSYVDLDEGTIDMELWLDGEAIYDALDAADGKKGDGKAAAGAGKLTRLTTATMSDEDKIYVFNKRDEMTATNQNVDKVVLGQLSFRVKPERLAEIVDLFDGLDVASDFRTATVPANEEDPILPTKRPLVDLLAPNKTKVGETFLLEIDRKASLNPGEKAPDPWQVGYYDCKASQFYRTEEYYNPGELRDNSALTAEDRNITERYIFDFKRDLIVSVELTNPDFTINAYQNYTDGKIGDLRLSMGRYANMVTVTYADGTRENQPFPWGPSGVGDTANGYSQRYIEKANLDTAKAWPDMKTSPITAYDPTANVANPTVGTDYIFSQKYQTFKKNADGTFKKAATGGYEVDYTFPVPVVGHMRVTPITVLAVTAEHMQKTYLLNDVVTQVPTVNELDLPNQARIITDIVPGNVSLVTPIKGWRSTQAASTWPTGNSSTAMNALKADSYVAPVPPATVGYPYWPDTADVAATSPTNPNYAPSHFVGDYRFETATTPGGAKEDILRSDIQKSFPWLTVPEPSYDVGKALRKIVEQKDYIDPTSYLVEYVSTVTKAAGGADPNGAGQPTLTLSVMHKLTSENMAEKSVFRVWLPNGLELGTGQNKGGVPVVNWFNDASLASTDPTYSDHVNGFYNTRRQLGPEGLRQIFHLMTNPSDPTQPVSTDTADYHNQDRETLRRYINLGGWYHVAICENPDDATPIWTDPIPVYVPPRRNEYQESKIYNFVGENQGLFNWPGGVGAIMAFPNGDYMPLTPNEKDYDGENNPNIGLPIYDVDGTITNGLAAPGDIYDSSPYQLKAGVERYEESYGVETTYDGQTGAQPGTIFSVKVDVDNTTHDADWTDPTTTERTHPSVAVATGGVWPAQGDPVTKHGKTPLYDGHSVPGFGLVNQPLADLNTYKATLRHPEDQDQPDRQLVEKVTLTSATDEGITRQPPGTKADNVTLVTFNTVTEGYTVREDHLLTINNVGDVDIYGLTIDNLVDGYNLNDSSDRTYPEGGHFEITVPPAQFLPAGTSTNFILTYVYDLRANNDSKGLKYRDTLYITSTSHPDPGQGEDYLLDFDAELTVSASPLHQVTVIYRPTDGSMGTAGLIVGEQTSGTSVVMNDTSTSRTYPKESLVYIHVSKEDEYAVKSVTAVIDGNTVDLLTSNEYGPGLSLPHNTDFKGTAAVTEGHEVYVFEMPNHDVTVYVNFYEPIESKLRLDGLIDFSDPDKQDLISGYDPTGIYEPSDPGHIYKVWKKEFVGSPAKAAASATGDYAAAQTWSGAHGNADENFYLMTQGSAIPATRGGDVYNSSNAHYLVVIDAEDDFSQIKAMLRNVKYHVDWRDPPAPSDPDYATYQNGYNLDVEPTVNMTLYYKDDVLNAWKGTAGSDPVYDPDHGFGPYASVAPHANLRPKGSTADKTYHITSDCIDPIQAGFASPDPGESAYVHIVVSYPGNTHGDAAGERHYYVEIHRRLAQPEVVLHYGNSPYGMIMNEQKFVTTPATGSATDVQAANDQTAKTRSSVKEAFRAGYTFRGADVAVRPDVVKDKLDQVIYWREAWVRNLGLFEPESLTGFHPVLVTAGPSPDPSANPGDQLFSDDAKTQPVYAPNVSEYNEADNLDLNDYAFFAILGQEMWEPGVVSAKDSSGRSVSLYDIRARALDEGGAKGVTLLDTTKTKQVDRFSGTATEIIDLGVAGQKLTALAEHAATPVSVATDSVLGVKQWPAKATVAGAAPSASATPSATPSATASASAEPSTSAEPSATAAPTVAPSAAPSASAAPVTTYSVIEDIRPGRYIIEYSYYDFDGVSLLTVTRPFVILREVGDVNVDGVRDAVRQPATGSAAAQSDEYAIEDRVTRDPLGYEAGGWNAVTKTETVYPRANIFKFRVADVNNDRNVNNIDANQVAKNVKDKAGWLRFYDPVDYGHPGSPMTAPTPAPGP